MDFRLYRLYRLGMYSPSITNLINAFKRLPTVGTRTAERFVFYLLKSGKKEVGELILALEELLEKVKSCEVCWNFSDTSPCPICSDTKRDHTIICVVAEPADLAVIERTGEYKGVYHVLRGLVDATDEESLSKTKIKELIERVHAQLPHTPLPPSRGEISNPLLSKEGHRVVAAVKEIILALNPDVGGETTMLYLEKGLKNINQNLKISRLARGLPMGGDLRYADEITLGSAIKNRIQRG